MVLQMSVSMCLNQNVPVYFLTHEILLTNYSAGDGPGGDVNPLLHERSQRKPEAVDHAEVVAHLKRQKSFQFSFF